MVQSFTSNSLRSNPSDRRTRRQKKALSSRCPRQFRPQFEPLEQRALLTVSIINGNGLGYVGNDTGGGSPPDVTGAAGPNSYLEVNNNTITLYSPKPGRTILAQDGINDFFFNAAKGNQTLIYSSTSTIAASPGGAIEVGTTVTITTTAPHGFVVGQSVSISGVGVAGYNGGVKITGTPTATTFTYTSGTSGLAPSGGGTVSGRSCGTCDSTGLFDNLMGANGRFIIGDIDVEGSQNVSQYIFAVSNSSNPTTFTTTDWNFYHVTTTEGPAGNSAWSDYPGNPGFNKDAFVETFNMFGSAPFGGNSQIVSINANDLANGVPQASLNVFHNDRPGFSYRATAMQDSAAGDPMWLIRNPEDGTNIQVVKMTNVLSNSASFTSGAATMLPLPAALNFSPSGINNPLNSDNTVMIDGDVDDDPENPGNSPASDVDNRILNASEFNNTIVAAHKVAVGTASVQSATVAISNGVPVGGSGYTVGDTLTLTGGTFSTAAQLTVATTGAGGSVTSVTVANPGSYTSFTGFTGAVTGGSGSGAKFSVNLRGELDVQWYAFNVSGGTPAFQQVAGVNNIGRIGFGSNTYSVEPAIAINSTGEIGLGFMESDTVGGAANGATGGFISTFVTARKSTDAAGTMQPVVLVPAGTGSGIITGRIGDFSGMNVDPVNGTFWHVNEFGGGGPTDIANFTPEDRPVVTGQSDQTAIEAAAKSFDLGKFADADGGPWTVTVNWGDGSPNTTFNVNSAGPLGSQSHTYAEESAATPYQVKVTVTDSTLLSGSNTFNVTVSDPAVTVNANSGGTLTTIAEGQSTPAGTVVGTFTDIGNPSGTFDPTQTSTQPEYVAVITWGNGSTDTEDSFNDPAAFNFTGGGTFQVRAPAHTYGEEGTFNISLTVTHDALSAVGPIQTASIVVSDPPVLATGVAANGKESIAFAAPVATFTDPGGAEPNPADPVGGISSHYTATTDWGDGTGPSVDTITYSGSPGSTTGVVTVTSTHTFAEEGTFTVTTIIDHEGIKTKVTSSSTIRDNYGLLVLDTTSAGALMVTGNGHVTVTNSGAIVVDSSNPRAIFLTGNAVVTATEVDVGIGGGAFTPGHATLHLLEPEFNHEAATPDPIALPLPPVPSTHFAAVHDSGGPLLTLSPGTYDGGIQVTGQGSVKLLPGIYYLNGGGLSVSGHGTITGTNVLIVNAPHGPNDVISFTGQAIVNLTASAGLTGANAAYNGITIFQDPASANTVTVTGQARLTMTGVLYAADALLKIDGNGNTVVSTDTPNTGGEVIVRDTMVTGNGVLTINADPPTIPLPIDSTGTLIVNAGSNLTASHIVLGSLVIGGTAGSPATVTIAASDEVGNALPAAAAASSSANATPSAAQQPAASNSSAGSTDSVGALSAADQPASAQATSGALNDLSTGGGQTLQVNDSAANSNSAQSGAPASSNLASLEAVFASDFLGGRDSSRPEWFGADVQTTGDESLAVSLTDDLLELLVAG